MGTTGLLRKSVFCIIFLPFVLGGCRDDRPAGMPKLLPVTLSFTQEGSPCEGASVRLISEETGGGKWSVGGATDAKGEVSLKTYGKFPGVPEGKYKIVVSKVERERLGTESDSMYDSRGEISYNLIDEAYGDANATDLRIEITKDGKYDPIELGPKIREKMKAPGD